MRLRVLATAAALLGGGRSLHAQALRVRATGEASGAPLSGAIVDVLDARGAVAGQALLDDAGRRLLPLRGPGTYRVRVRRIGFEPFVSAPVAVAAADTLDLPLRVPERRIALGAVRVTDARRCALDGSGAVATLLEEARKALTATALGRLEIGDAGAGRLAVEGRTFVRRLDAEARVVDTRVDFPRRVRGRPFVAASAAELSDSGYVRWGLDGTTFFGPDEQVLASDEFVRDHCFDIVAGRGPTAGLFGVRFTPARRRASDIAGVLWVDSASAELQHLDFWYEDRRLPFPARGPGRAGGQVVFGRLPTGRWMVTAWRLRMPRFPLAGVTAGSRPVDWMEEGGVVTPDPPDGSGAVAAQRPYLELIRPAHVAGIVFDSLTWQPLAGALVRLSPVVTDDPPSATGPELSVRTLVDTTDAAGRYAFDSLAAGSYRLEFDHPATDSLAIPLPSRDVRLAPGTTADGTLAVPSRATLSRGCLQATRGVEGGILLGTVRSADGRAVARATVRVGWADPARGGALTGITATTDGDGGWRVCGVPAGGALTVQALPPRAPVGAAGRAGSAGSAGGAARVVFGERRVARVDLVLPVTDR